VKKLQSAATTSRAVSHQLEELPPPGFLLSGVLAPVFHEQQDGCWRRLSGIHPPAGGRPWPLASGASGREGDRPFVLSMKTSAVGGMFMTMFDTGAPRQRFNRAGGSKRLARMEFASYPPTATFDGVARFLFPASAFSSSADVHHVIFCCITGARPGTSGEMLFCDPGDAVTDLRFLPVHRAPLLRGLATCIPLGPFLGPAIVPTLDRIVARRSRVAGIEQDW